MAGSTISQDAANAKLAVIGVVRHLTTPEWNTENGLPTKKPHASPWRYRDASVEVTEVLWQTDPYASIKPGAHVDVRLWADGSDQVAIDDHVLWLLHDAQFAINTSKSYYEVTVTGLVAHYMGAWRIDGENAVNLEPSRTKPLATLLAELRAARG